MSNQEYIKIEGAYENNLKHISLDIPKKQITIFTCLLYTSDAADD